MWGWYFDVHSKQTLCRLLKSQGPLRGLSRTPLGPFITFLKDFLIPRISALDGNGILLP